MFMINELLNEAIDLINKEQFSPAAAKLKKIIELDDKNIEAYKNLGLCEVNLDNPQDAIKAFENVVELDKKDATALFYLASCLNRVGEKEKAIENFEKVISLRPDFLDAYKSIAMINIEFSQLDSAIEIAKMAIENPSLNLDSSIYYIIATSYMLKKDYHNASIYLEKGLLINDKHVQILNSLAVCYMNLGEFEKSFEVLTKAVECDEDNSLTYYNFGILYQTKNEFKKALECFQKSYQIEPTSTMLATMANCALASEDYTLASNLYQNLTLAYPNNEQYRLSYIKALEMVNNYQEALDNVNMLLGLDEKNIDLIKKKGTLLRKLGKYQESIDTFFILINRGKIDVEVYYNLAFNYVEMNDFDNAKEMFKKCITLEPNNPYAHKDLGVLYLKMNCYDWAVDEMLEAIKLEDDVSEFHYSLGVAYTMLNRINEAKVAFNKAWNLDSGNIDALSYLGYIDLLNGDKKSALEKLQEAIKLDSGNFLAKLHLAKYYFQERNWENAKQLLLDILEKTNDDETKNMLAISFMELGEYQEALGLFSKLIKDYPKNHMLLVNLAKCEYKTLKKDQALEQLRQALLIFEDYPEALELLEEINNGK